jgi:hypothetical protein
MFWTYLRKGVGIALVCTTPALLLAIVLTYGNGGGAQPLPGLAPVLASAAYIIIFVIGLPVFGADLITHAQPHRLICAGLVGLHLILMHVITGVPVSTHLLPVQWTWEEAAAKYAFNWPPVLLLLNILLPPYSEKTTHIPLHLHPDHRSRAGIVE